LEDIKKIKQDLSEMNTKLFQIYEQYIEDFESYKLDLNKIETLRSEMNDTYGKVILLEKKSEESENNLTTTRRQLHDAIKILAKHKEKLSKL
jgi:cell division septum initiation protein DivIVA